MLIIALTRLFRAEMRGPLREAALAPARSRGLMMGGEKSPIETTSFHHPFADLVAMAGWLHPIPFRTRP
jgi:hypothetical protein